MILKTLELYGFKSFAEKIKLEFDQGITAIVGPNGSGKSNIVDAVRWVLGEQSAKTLRGLRMEDIIFAGSDEKKPLGVAEVSITFDNTSGFLPLDYNEVTITRRVFRSGESEYYLNKSGCRLKDINELFLDTGIGKEGYSIIGQGKIDEILSIKPDDRRHIFEEAAGIAKYKSRKEEAERKIEETKQNITRINDIISELEYQLIPLKEQSDRATIYKDLTERLKTFEVNFYFNKLDRLSDILNKFKNDADDKRKKIETAKNDMILIEEEISNKTIDLKTIEEKIYEVQNQVYNCSIELEKVQAQIERSIEKINNLDENKITNSIKKEKISDILEELQINLKSELDNFEDLITTINQKELLLKKKTEELEEFDKVLFEEEQLADERKNETLMILQKISEKRNDLVSKQTTRKSLVLRYQQAQEQSKKLDKKREEANAVLSKNKKRIDEIMELINKISKENDLYLEEQKKLEMSIQSTEGELKQLNELKHSKQSRLQFLNEMEREYIGFNKSVRNVLKSIPKEPELNKGFCGVIAKLIETDKKYELAVEAALGSAVQYFVTETSTDAAKIISFLKKCNLGRATFLPLDTIKPRGTNYRNEGIKTLPGYIAFAKDVVRYESKYGNVIKYLLGRVVIAKDIDSALEIAKNISFSCKIVTLDGDIINPGGAITGGSKIKNNLFLNRGREIKDVQQQLNKINEENRLLEQNKHETILKLNTIRKKILDNNDIYRKLDLELNLLQEENKNMFNARKEIETSQHYLNKELNKLKDEDKELNQEISLLTMEISLIEENNKKVQESIYDYQKIFKEKKTKREIINKEITELKVGLATLKQEELMFVENIKRMETEIKNQKENAAKINNEIKNADLLTRVFQENLENYKKQKTGLCSRKNEYDEYYKKLNDQRLKLKDEIENLNLKIKELNTKSNEIQEQLHKIEIKLTKYQMEANTIENTLWSKYSINYKEAANIDRQIQTNKGIVREIRELKAEIESLGEINLGAVEEYKRVKERYNFLVDQKNDLIDAQEHLNKAIEEVLKQMERQFIECFDAINKNFKEVFKDLFDGGKAMLMLADPEDVLSSGIEIVAQPPGKKLQNISLLSGGEKALTAIALLFGILKHKPTPFCILDEIETSLDDTNLKRFTRYLLKLSEETQFILITHRKETMEAAKVLYGITMEESATSKIISVRLDEAS
ncbi:MAG TPA: chromosome segregation protein SMC [Thermoanaerobacterales bacterium]|nr:chromosome segregation protein SMC [Thermoanaerobacterales bacterium]